MKVKQLAIVAALMLAAIAPVKAQNESEWKRLSDTTWARWGENSMGAYAETAAPADIDRIVSEINNDLRKVARLKAGVLACGAVASIGGIWAARNVINNKSVTVPGVVVGVAGLTALGLQVAEIVTLNREMVYITPEGVVVSLRSSGKKKFIEVAK